MSKAKVIWTNFLITKSFWRKKVSVLLQSQCKMLMLFYSKFSFIPNYVVQHFPLRATVEKTKNSLFLHKSSWAWSSKIVQGGKAFSRDTAELLTSLVLQHPFYCYSEVCRRLQYWQQKHNVKIKQFQSITWIWP